MREVSEKLGSQARRNSMSENELKRANQKRRQHRTRCRISGTSDRPRLSVKITNRHIIAQIINDDEGKTIAYAKSTTIKKAESMTDRAEKVGEEIARQAKLKKVNKVVLDRGSKLYHGRIKAMADKAREKGLEF